MRRRLTASAAIILLSAALAAAAGASAQPKPAQIVGIASVKLDRPLASGRTSNLEIFARILPGWHINSDRPLNTAYIPTRLIVAAPGAIAVGSASYPPAQQLSLGFSPGEKLSVFTGDLKLAVAVKPKGNLKPGSPLPVTVTIRYQACNNRLCLRPASVSATIDLDGAGAATPDASATVNGNAAQGLAQAFKKYGYVAGFLLVLLGGLALNLTPCVYPLIGVTLAYFAVQGGGPRKVAVLAVIYVVGIALMFSALGVAAALSGGIFGAALQNPYVLMAIAAMLLVLAASSFGLFSLRPPQWMMQRVGQARPGYLGALAMGLGMGVVAAPCIGPIVLGLLLMVEESRSALFGFALFFTLAMGLGSPYVMLALAAGSIQKLPRSGDWLAWIEQLFGFVLVGLALYFLDPIVPGRLITRLLPYYAAAAGVFLGFISPAGRRWRPFLVLRVAIGTLSAAAFLYLLASAKNAPAQLTFEPFDNSLLSAAKAEHKPVILDFSADWCIPCREMERTTFVDPAVIKAASRFVRLRANLTNQDDRTKGIIDQFRIQGVPTSLFIDAEGKVRSREVGYVDPAEYLKHLRQLH